MIRILSNTLLFVAAIGLCSCGMTQFTVPVTRPAEINLKNYKQIAIGSIQGKYGQDLEEELTMAIMESGRFEVLDRQHLGQILQEHNLGTTEYFDQNNIPALGKLIGSSAFIFGRIKDGKYSENDKLEETVIQEGKGSYKIYTRSGYFTMTVHLEITDVSTGKKLFAKDLTQAATGRTQGDRNAVPPPIDRNELLKTARLLVVQDFMRRISQYQEYVEVVFLTDGDLPNLEHGVDFAKQGDWQAAIERFVSAKDANPNSGEAWYDLGVAYGFNFQFQESREALQKATVLGQADMVSRVRATLNRLESDYIRLRDQ